VALTLQQHGWTNVRPLVGGFEAWRKAGYPTEPKASREQQTKLPSTRADR